MTHYRVSEINEELAERCTELEKRLAEIQRLAQVLQSQCLEAYEVDPRNVDLKLTALSVATGVAFAMALQVQRAIAPEQDPLRSRVAPFLSFTKSTE